MARKVRKQFLALALRRVGSDNYGEDFIAAGATAVAMQTKGVSITPFAGDEIDRELDDGGVGNSPVLLVGTHVTVSGSIEVAGSGSKDLPAAYSPLLQICARGETITADTEVTHSRITNNSELDATVYYYKDGALHKILGARGKVKLTAKAKELAYFEFELTGLYGGIVEQAFAAPVLNNFIKPEKVGKVHTSFTLDGQPYKLIDFEADDGNEVSYEEYVGYEEVLIGDWKPSGKITIEAPALGDYNPFAVAEGEAQMAIDLTQGTVEGNIVRVTSGKIQLGRPEYGDQNGTVTYSIPFRFIEDFAITTK